MRALFVLLLLGVSTTGASAQRLHVVFALEKNNVEMGLISLGNDELMTQVMKTVEWGLGYPNPMTMTYLPKQDFTSTKLKSTLAGLQTGPNDVIVLYYSGVGAMPTRPTDAFANWQLTDVAKQGLPVSDVETWLMAKKARLRVIIADCSAQLIPPGMTLEATVTSGPDLRKQVIQRLFQQPCGLVKLGSSLPSQPAWALEGMTGSVFTKGFNQGLQNLLSATGDSASLARVSWSSIQQFTAEQISVLLAGLPSKQQPMLELKPCQN